MCIEAKRVICSFLSASRTQIVFAPNVVGGAIKCAIEMAANHSSANQTTGLHHIGNSHRFGEHGSAMLVKRTTALFAARDQSFKMAHWHQEA
jgi:hypothetical protein